jgi:hypothetical protein
VGCPKDLQASNRASSHMESGLSPTLSTGNCPHPGWSMQALSFFHSQSIFVLPVPGKAV